MRLYNAYGGRLCQLRRGVPVICLLLAVCATILAASTYNIHQRTPRLITLSMRHSATRHETGATWRIRLKRLLQVFATAYKASKAKSTAPVDHTQSRNFLLEVLRTKKTFTNLRICYHCKTVCHEFSIYGRLWIFMTYSCFIDRIESRPVGPN